tara:strand:+ start:1586 stop:1819 length:234 start_codon:yes stop_codon:yes gene_type:complete
MSDRLDKTISKCFKKIDSLKKDLKKLTLLLGHLEETAKKIRDNQKCSKESLDEESSWRKELETRDMKMWDHNKHSVL